MDGESEQVEMIDDEEKLNHFVGIFTEKGKLEDVEMDTEDYEFN
jgi:hypothetical protein